MFKKYTISNDPNYYEAWPDIALTISGKLICVFAECTHHKNRSYSRIVMCESKDKGRSWSKKKALTESTEGKEYYYNCPRIGQLKDGRIYIIVDKCIIGDEAKFSQEAQNLIYFSDDDGVTWGTPEYTPLRGIVPDKILELPNGRWIISAHYHNSIGELAQYMHYSDDKGKTWSPQIVVGQKNGLNLCEVSILHIKDNTLVAFMRENSGKGLDCIKTISYNNGESWSEPIAFPIPGCHRPVAGFLNDGKIFITYRFMQGGNWEFGRWSQNFFGAVTDIESVLALKRNDSWTRILPIDYDRSSKSDLGYSGWVQLPDNEVYIANYIVDDAIDRAQIRGYSCNMNDFML